MKSNNQVKIQEPSFEEGVFTIPKQNLTRDETKSLIKSLQTLIKRNCNVATVSAPMVRSLFESVDNPEVLTIYINTDEDFMDIRGALKIEKDSLLSLLDGMMEYYKDRESLNIIIKRHVLRNHGDTFYRFSASFAQQVAAKTQEFLKVKVIYDSEKELLGVFCRKNEFDISLTFFGQLIDTFKSKQEAYVLYTDMPDTYVTYPSMLHYKLKKELNLNSNINMQKMKNGLRFYFKKPRKGFDNASRVE